jgi:hypothetical protein
MLFYCRRPKSTFARARIMEADTGTETTAKRRVSLGGRGRADTRG